MEESTNLCLCIGAGTGPATETLLENPGLVAGVAPTREWRKSIYLVRPRGDRRRSNALANPPFLRNVQLEIGTGAGAIAVRIESHLVGGRASAK